MEGLLEMQGARHALAKKKDPYSFSVDGKTIETTLKGNLTPIHPALGVFEGEAYVSVWAPSTITDDKGQKEEDQPYLVTSNRELILANDITLKEKRLRLSHKPVQLEARWPLNSVKAFLEGATVDPCKVFTDVLDVWLNFIDFPNPAEYVYQTLWDLLSYVHDCVNAVPYDNHGGSKRTGKTKALTVHSVLAFNAFLTANMSTSSLFRLIQNARGTMLLDESDKLSDPERARDFRSILFSGYKKGGRTWRVEKNAKDRYVPESFEVFGMKAMASIASLGDVLEDRSKNTIHRRSLRKDILNREVDTTSSKWGELRSGLYMLRLDYWREFRDIYEKLCELGELSEQVNLLQIPPQKAEDLDLLVSRELEIWRPIFALALFLDRRGVDLYPKYTSSQSSLSSLMFQLAIEGARERQVENLTETSESVLVQVLCSLVGKDDYYRVHDIKVRMKELYDGEQDWLNEHWIGRALRRLGFKEKRRVGTGYQYKFSLREVADLAARMGVGGVEASQTKLTEIASLDVAEEIILRAGPEGLERDKLPGLLGERVEPGSSNKLIALLLKQKRVLASGTRLIHVQFEPLLAASANAKDDVAIPSQAAASHSQGNGGALTVRPIAKPELWPKYELFEDTKRIATLTKEPIGWVLSNGKEHWAMDSLEELPESYREPILKYFREHPLPPDSGNASNSGYSSPSHPGRGPRGET